jgi:hypothetical protein
LEEGGMQKLLYTVVSVAGFSFFAPAAYANVVAIDPTVTIFNAKGNAVGSVSFDVDSNGSVSNVTGNVQGNAVQSGSGQDVNGALDLDFSTSAGSYHIEPYSGGGESVIFPNGARGTAGTPELSTWLMLILGFGLVALRFAYVRRPVHVASLR